MTTPARPAETEAILDALQVVSPCALTACADWTAHDIAAHLAGVCEEVLRHLRGYAEGQPMRTTRGFEEREAPFRQMPYAGLVTAIDHAEQAMRSGIGAILARQPDAVLAWTGRQMRIDAFLPHLRSECAIHRWDLLGDDETSWRLLGQFELFKHAVTAIGAGPMTARGVAAGAAAQGLPATARLRSDGYPDLLVAVGEAVRLTLTEPDGEATIVADQAARLLVLWGRTPQPPVRVVAAGPQPDVLRVRRLLSGY